MVLHLDRRKEGTWLHSFDLIQRRRNVKNIGSGQVYVVGEAKVKIIAIENIFYIEIVRVSLELFTATQLKSLANKVANLDPSSSHITFE